MVLFDRGSNSSTHTDTVAAHDEILFLAVAVLESCVESLAVTVSQLEDVADLNASGQLKSTATGGAPVFLRNLPYFSHNLNFEISAKIDMLQVVIFFIGADSKICQCCHLLVCNYGDFQTHGSKIAARHTGNIEHLLFISQFDIHTPYYVLQLHRLDLVITPDKHGNGFFIHQVNHGLDKFRSRDIQKPANIFNFFLPGGFHSVHWQKGYIWVADPWRLGSCLLHVSGIITIPADHQCILPGVSKYHEFM